MNKFLTIVALAATLTACNNEAKTDTTTGDTTVAVPPVTPEPAPTTTTTAPVKDSVMQFKEGKVLIMTGGTWAPLTAALTTSNGRKVSPNGEVSKGKVTRKLEEGMMIDKDGQMMDKDGKLMDNTGWE